MSVTASTGCIRAGTTQMRVRDPGAVGVVDDRDDHWLAPPQGVAEEIPVYENFARKDTLERSPRGAITYVTKGKVLFPATMQTPLVDARGSVWPWTMPGVFGPLGGPGKVVEKIQRGDPVRLPVHELGECGTYALGQCSDVYAASPMSLAIDSHNVREVRVVREPVRLFGIAEVPMGLVLGGFGVVDGVGHLGESPTKDRNVSLAVDGAAVVGGALLIANGLWYLLAPKEEQVVYRAAEP